VEEAAEYFHVLPSTIRSWIRSGRLLGTKIGKQYFIPEPEVKKMLLADRPKTDSGLDGISREELVSEFVNGVRIKVSALQIWEDRRQRNSRRRAQLERCAECQ